MSRTIAALRLVVPAVWLGVIGGLSFIEAPLKFTAPGITIPLGLGIGRLVFNALTIVGLVFLITIVVISLLGGRFSRPQWLTVIGVGVVFAAQALIVRPALNARSDIIIAGGDPGGSGLHYWYIALEVVIMLLLLLLIIQSARALQLVPIALKDSAVE